MRLTRVTSDDWEGLYLDNKLIAQNHSVDTYYALMVALKTTNPLVIDRVVYDFGHVKRVAYLNSDNDCVIFKTYAIQCGEITELLDQDIVTESECEIALSLLRGK